MISEHLWFGDFFNRTIIIVVMQYTRRGRRHTVAPRNGFVRKISGFSPRRFPSGVRRTFSESRVCRSNQKTRSIRITRLKSKTVYTIPLTYFPEVAQSGLLSARRTHNTANPKPKSTVVKTSSNEKGCTVGVRCVHHGSVNKEKNQFR